MCNYCSHVKYKQAYWCSRDRNVVNGVDMHIVASISLRYLLTSTVLRGASKLLVDLTKNQATSFRIASFPNS